MASYWKRCLLLTSSVLVAVAASSSAQPPAVAQPGQPLNITVTSASPSPDVTISLNARSSRVSPARTGYTRTGGGNIDVQTPTADTCIITMTGAAVAYPGPFHPAAASQNFELIQEFEISFDKRKIKTAKLTIEGRVIGFLRSEKVGSAEQSAAATFSGAGAKTAVLAMPAHSVCAGQNLSINDKEGPVSTTVTASSYTLTQSFRVAATAPKSILPSKAPSAEFAPDPALDPLWISMREPFHGAKKGDLGFQVTIKVAADELVPEVPPRR